MEIGKVGCGFAPLGYSGSESVAIPIVSSPIYITITTPDAGIQNGATYLLMDGSESPINIQVSYGGSLWATFYSVADNHISITITAAPITEFLNDTISTVDNGIYVSVAFPEEYGNRFSPIYLWDNYESDGTSITIPIASLPGLTAAEADAVTGDWREILQAIFVSSWDHSQLYIEQSLASQLDTYKIHKQDIYRTTINSYFQIKFLTDMGEPNVAPES